MSELLNGKFKCVVSEFCDVMTEGKIYEFKNGRYMTDEGDLCNLTYKNIEHFNGISPNIIKIEPYNPQPKDLLQMGRIVKLKNGKMGFVLKESIIYKTSLTTFEAFNDDLICDMPYCNEWSISEIYEATQQSCFEPNGYISYLGNLVWKREELTPEQIKRKAIEQELREVSEKMEELADKLAKLDNIK